jgi:probable F420-dependent oxidoreductase
MQISVIISGLSMLYGNDLGRGLLDTARLADAAGIDQLVMTDHLAMGPHVEKYPYGKFPFPLDEPWPEPLTTLAAMAGATQRVRLGTGILIAPLRPALLLAKTLATLDVLSQGRLDLGVGTGWQAEEFAGAGLPFEGRGSRMDDTLRACRALWRDTPASFSSPTVSFDELWCLPRPVQPGGIPIWFGLRLNPKNVARIVEFGAGWMPLLDRDEELWSGVEQLRRAFREAGRDPDSLGVRVTPELARDATGRIDLDRTLDALPKLEEAGGSVASFALAACVRSRDEIPGFLQRVGRGAR